MIELVELTRRFGALVAVDGVSLKVDAGEALGFLGPNGAGKTTTMRMIAGALAPSGGWAAVCGFDVVADPLQAKACLGFLPEGAPLYDDMTPAGFLAFVARARGLHGKAGRLAVGRAVDLLDLGAVLGQPIETLSKGFRRRVGIAQAIMHDPPALILDEPTDGLDPNQKHQVRALIREMAAEKAIIISTHILEEVEAVCTRAVIIGEGRVLADATADELKARMPYHNAVSIVVGWQDAAELSVALERVEGVAEVASEPLSEGTATRILAFPHNGRAIAGPVAEEVARRRIAVHDMTVEQGLLDDVFRSLTAGGGPTREQAHG